MKTSDRLLTLLLLLAAPAARWLERRTLLDAEGLPVGGLPYLVPLLASAASIFLYSARRLPARDAVTADFGGVFRFDGQLPLTAGIAGAFLVVAASALRAVSGGNGRVEVLLSVFLALSGAAMLYVLVCLRRGSDLVPVTLLVPACYLVVQLIITYRENARDSVLLHYSVQLLALAALCLAALYLAAFAYRCGSPRSFSFVAHLALVLTAASCVDLLEARQLDLLAAALGAMLLLAAFLEAAGDFEG